jgi:glycerol-1-phosphate dehydrogenase [NAD(P)+]
LSGHRLPKFPWLERIEVELSQLLGTAFGCECGKTHSLPVRKFVYDSTAIEQLPEIVHDCADTTSSMRVAVVADARTWEVCGQRVLAALRRTHGDAAELIVADGEHGTPICDDATFQALLTRLRDTGAGIVVAVGSGVVNDLCKWTSFELGMPYVVVATAASMNGYAAANVAATVAGVKTLIEARPPLAVVAEPEVIAGAPQEMISAGFGDTIAKYQSNSDWRMNHLLLGEYYCDFCAGIVADLEPLYLARPEGIKERDASAVGGLFAALFWSGVAMTLVGTSAPASGGEHLLSHTLDMIAMARGHRHDLHGRQVGVGTLVSAALYERILAIESPKLRALPPVIDERFWGTGPVVEAVARQYEAKKAGLDAVRRRLTQRGAWDQLRNRLTGLPRPPQTIRNWLERAGGATSPEAIGCSKEQLREAALHMHEIRKRFTVVDLAWMVGVLPDSLDEIVQNWLSR